MNKSTNNPQSREFKADLRQVLDIITHSLYSHREIFLRELISNATDALDKLRFESLTQPELMGGDAELKIRIFPDPEAGTLTISDSGIGMDLGSIQEDLGTIARSGTREFLQRLQDADAEQKPELIGQFGVGFYSSFMVSNEVTVLSRSANGETAVRWKSTGEGEYTVEDAERAARGTDVVLHLREDAREFLEPHRLRALVKKYSDFIEHPVALVTTNDEGELVEEVVNSQVAIWVRSPSEVTDEEYKNFYRQISRDVGDPFEVIHYAAEGTLEFRALLFIPGARPWDMLMGDMKSGLHLYIQRVLIMSDSEDLLPEYLRFVVGVVDCPDLPLNVSRELLQENPVLARIRKNLTNKVLKELSRLKSDERSRYEEFYRQFGVVLKEGVTRDPEQRDAVADLLLFESTQTQSGESTTLEHYTATMAEGQDAIYYLIGENSDRMRQSPYVERFEANNLEVLLLTDPIDEFLAHALSSYHDVPLKAVDKGELEISEDEKDSDAVEAYQPLMDYLTEQLNEVEQVRLSHRLESSASVLVVQEGAAGAHLERLLEKMGRGDELPGGSRGRILELNPRHPAVQAMRSIYEADSTDSRTEDFARLLYDQAVLSEGSMVKDPAEFARRINDLIARSAHGGA